MKLKLIFVCLAIALVQIAPLNAQSFSPEGRYTDRGAGELRVEKTGEGWRVFVAAGVSRGDRTSANCILIAEGEIKDNAFQGEIKYTLDTWDEKPSPGNAEEPGNKITITFMPQGAALFTAHGCGFQLGLLDRYWKLRK